jgi:hypothetical protein
VTGPVTPADRPIGSHWTYVGVNHPRAPIGCEIVERYDDLPKCMYDCCVRCDDGSLVVSFDANLHAQGCVGSPRDMSASWFPAKEWEQRNPPCPCGAGPMAQDHKFKRLLRTKNVLQTKAEMEHEDLVVNFDGPIPVAVERKVS